MAFWGADTEALRAHAELTGRGAAQIDDIAVRLGTLVHSVEWVGTDADGFRQIWDSATRILLETAVQELRQKLQEMQDHAEEQDGASDGIDSTAGIAQILETLIGPVRAVDPSESDGFFGDLFGGPESGLLGNYAWNMSSAAVDLATAVPVLGLPGTITGLVMDVGSIPIGIYDMTQSFQDGDLFGTVDGAITTSLNTADATMGALSLFPPTMVVGEIGGVVTGGLDAAWSAATAQAQVDGMRGGESEGSTSRYLLDMVGVDSTTLDAADATFAKTTGYIRDKVPFIDPALDGMQSEVERVVPSFLKPSIENSAGWVNSWLPDLHDAATRPGLLAVPR
ncbi:MAG TPA: WXG100 family type VII secretion target [Candidatus Brachybacterium merdigallinarum]|nr:WXG100 family type VII secretion target [Candidatus Brachybacterium merdigallinarum]